jgi:uncharacterized membrane protein YbaN (DUF454 family)
MSNLVDIVGFGAAAATLATFAQTRAVPMRVLAIAANLLFIGYGTLGAVYPVMLLHVMLLPVNLWRLAIHVGPARKSLRPEHGFGPLLPQWREQTRAHGLRLQ